MRRYFLIKKSKKALFTFHHRYQLKKNRLNPEIREDIKKNLLFLQNAILKKDYKKIEHGLDILQTTAQPHLKKQLLESIRDFIGGIGGALVLAILIRQMWFELYEIPTGSMRPTFKEKDRLSVSKTCFGINYPLKIGHFYFDPSLIKRNNIVIFTVENMDVRNGDTVYFYIFPGKKLLIKRLIGKPGDILYFYGGKIYGIDENEKDISPELQLTSLDKIDHIPFVSFEGSRITVASVGYSRIVSPVVLYQMNQPIAKLTALNMHQGRGDFSSEIQAKYGPNIQYSDLWGIQHFAMARLLTAEQLLSLDKKVHNIEEGVLYLELKHHPTLNEVTISWDELRRLRPCLGSSTSILPLKQKHLEALRQHLYTCRFVVQKGIAYRYGINPSLAETEQRKIFPLLSSIPDGVYEFYYGKAYQIHAQGIAEILPPSHPLSQLDTSTLQLLFNLGMEFDNRFDPKYPEWNLSPSRYAYFRDGDLYIMGGVVFEKDDPVLKQFIEKETQKSSSSYTPFIDRGPPLKSNGNIDIELIKKYGLKVPPKSYFVLGDNHANSGDSRDFGFVPEENLKGGPSLIFWPPGPRIGPPNQPKYPLFNKGRVLIWIIAGSGYAFWYYRHKKLYQLPLTFE